MAESFTLQANGHEIEFRSDKQLYNWWKKEADQWRWIWEEDVPVEFKQIKRLGVDVNGMVDNKRPMGEIIGSLRTIFGSPDAPHLFLSSSAEGDRYLTAYRRAGSLPAATLLYVENAQNGQQKLQAYDWVMNFALGAAAACADGEWTRADLDKERRAYRHAIERLEQRVRDIEAERDAFVRSRKKRIRRWAAFAFNRLREDVTHGVLDFSAKRDAIIQDLAATKSQYTSEIAFLAPVTYWKTKARSHGHWEIGWAIFCIIYFGAAAWAIFQLAKWASDLLIAAATAATPAPLYIVIGGATLGVSTLIFWFGRLITKLFLSEHHLREQCAEKAVMMEAFLAMKNEGSFGSEERAIVIASVFRPSGDGLIREDGPPDLAAQAQFAKLVTRP